MKINQKNKIMPDPILTTEKIILEAAKKVFLEKGFEGSRMQLIADEADINKALLHYYFRSKDNLFEAIFEEAFMQFLPNISQVLNSELPLVDKVNAFVEQYINMLQNNPHLPIFIMRELQREPQRIIELIKKLGLKPELIEAFFKKEKEKNQIVTIPTTHLLVNIISLCVFPFMARPIIEGIVFNNDKEAFNNFLQERKKLVADFIINAITVK